MLRTTPGLFLVLGAACSEGATAAEIAEDVVPAANAVTIYSAGGSVVSGSTDAAALGGRRLRLPASAAAIHLSQDDKSLQWFTVQALEPKAKDKEATHKLIGLPPLGPNQLDFNYALADITWTLKLEAEIVSPKSVNLELLAMINMNASETYRNADVTLVLNNAVSVEKLAASTFKLSSFDLYPRRNINYSLGSKAVEYSFIREWNAYAGRDDVRVLLQVKNPFSVDLDQTATSVEANRIIVESGTIGGQAGQGAVLSLPAGVDDTISTFRSVKITEATDKRPLPFNHKISYDIVNHADQPKKLRLITSRVLGIEHRSVYHFTQPPDATPENTLVWILELAPKSTRKLEFDYDADIKDVEGEDGFEKGG